MGAFDTWHPQAFVLLYAHLFFLELGDKDGILAHFSHSPTAVLQGHLDATLDYPMYYKLKNAFQSKQTMRNIHDGVTQNCVFPDTSVLATFVDNHDNPRFISENSDWTTLKNALAYIMFAQASAWREGGREGFNVLLVVGTRTIPSLPLSQGEVQHEASITGGGGWGRDVVEMWERLTTATLHLPISGNSHHLLWYRASLQRWQRP